MSDYYYLCHEELNSGCCLKCTCSYPGCMCFECSCKKCSWYTLSGPRRCGKIDDLNQHKANKISTKIELTEPKCFHYSSCGGFVDVGGAEWPHEDCYMVCKGSRVFKMIGAYQTLCGLDWEPM
jgi:hypothetical protein